MVRQIAFLLPFTFLLACDDDALLAEAESAPFISYEEYKQLHTEQLSDGSWVVESDILFDDEDGVRRYYDRLAAKACEGADECLRSMVRQDSAGNDVVWSSAEKLDLSYCIGDVGGTTNYNRVKNALTEATRDWETSADINFIHVSSEDGSGCNSSNDEVLIHVISLPSCTGNYLAFADFPSDETPGLRYCPAGLAKNDADLLWITKHELGHILGLVHEHFGWSQSDATCQADSDDPRRNVYGADPYSIMGYEYCNGTLGDNKTLSGPDRIGIGRLYNIPRGHGRLNGTAFNQANSFLSNGVSDDIFWHVPGGTHYQLWATIASPAIGFIKYTNAYPVASQEDWRPMGLQWVSNGDANFNREVLFYGPDSISDKLFINLNNGSFSASSVTKTGWPIPLVGNFHGTNTYTELLWWTQGISSSLWQMDSGGSIDASTAYTQFYDDVSEPLSFGTRALTGDFGVGAAAGTQILWYGDCWGHVTRGTGSSGFETRVVDMLFVTDSCTESEHLIPLLGDFDGDARGDIFWYGPGSRFDRLVLNRDVDLYESYSNIHVSRHDLPVNGHYKPIVGDFNGDFKSDIFWYQPGAGGDSVWLFTGAGTYNSYSRTVNGDYAPMPGDFNNDGCDDIVWYDPPNDKLYVWRSDCDGTFTEDPTHTVPDGAYPIGYGIGY